MPRYRKGLGLYLEIVDHATGRKKILVSRSPVMNFMSALAGLLTPKTTGVVGAPATSYYYIPALLATIKDYNGSSVSLLLANSATYYNRSPITIRMLDVTAPAGDITYGIVAGRGTTPASPHDYKLESPYPEGDGEGKLRYGATSVEGPALLGKRVAVRVIRTISNTHTSSQSITELGLGAKQEFWYRSNARDTLVDIKFLIARDVFTTPIVLPPDSSVTVAYVFQSVI